MYLPPFTVSAEAINLIAEISAQIERYAIRLEQEDGLRLRKANRIKTIHSSLAIEGNTLSEDEVRDIIDGKNVVAPIRQIQEVKNAIKTYELYPTLDAFNEKDLLKAHGVIMEALEAAVLNGASVPGITPTDTQKEIDEKGFVVRHLVRSSLVAVQTPQCFKFKELLEAHGKAAADGREYTDDTEIWGQYCGPVRVTKGDVNNIKITYPADLEALK